MATRLANSCSQSLNVLAGFIGPPLVVLPLSSVVGHQRSAVDHLSACSRRFVSRLGTSVQLSVDENKHTFSLIQRHSQCPPPPRHVPDPYHSIVNAIPLVAENVSLPDAPPRANLLDILPPHLAKLYASPAEVTVDSCLPRRFRAVPFSTDHADYVKLILRLADLEMITFMSSPKVVNGCFGTPKKDGKIRFVVDARPANFFFTEPPDVSLPTPDVLCALAVPPGERLFIAKADLSAFYHQLRTPAWMWEFFGLPPVHAKEVGLEAVWGDTIIFPCLTTLPMGWTHAVSLAQAGHIHVVESARIMPPRSLIGPLENGLSTSSPRYSIYIDDTVFAGPCPKILQIFLDSYVALMESLCLPVSLKKTVRPSRSVEAIGILFHNETAGMDPRKLIALCQLTSALLAAPVVHIRTLRSVVGKWNWAILARRPAFAVFQSVYVFMQRFPDFRSVS